MKRLFVLLGLGMALLQAAPTYYSITSGASDEGYKGFREQVMHVPVQDDTSASDITLSYASTVPYNAALIDQTPDEAHNLNLGDINWCSRGMLRVKIYVPPHLKEFKIAMQFFPINYGVGFATFRPVGAIDEQNAKDKGELGTKTYNRYLWQDGKTVSFVFAETMDISFNDYTREKYGIDTSKGGYLYLSFTQAPDLLLSARDYDSRYKIGFVVDMEFEHPFTDALRNEVLAAIPAGLTEPVEPVQHVFSKQCRDPKEFDLVTEVGEAIDPDVLCEDTGGVYENNTCYYLPKDQEKYDCEITDGDQWNETESRCIRPEEIACNATAGKKWYVAGEKCLNTIDRISTPNGSGYQPIALAYDANDTAYRFFDYEANGEGWSTQLSIYNLNATSAVTQKVKVRNGQGDTIGSYEFSVQPQGVWNGRLFFERNALKLEGPADSAASGTEFTVMSMPSVEGSIIVEPLDPAKMAEDETAVDMTVGFNLPWQGQVDVSAAEQECIDRGGFYSADTGECYGGTGGGTVSTSSSSSSSSYYRPPSSTGGSTSSVSTAAEKACIAAGGFYSADTGECYGATVSTASSSSSSSSSSAVSSDPYDYGDYSELSENEAVAQALAGRTFKIDGWFAHYDFEDSIDAFDWVFMTPKKNVYRLHGTKAREDSVFGWKKVYIKVPEEDLSYAMVYMGDWDHDGSEKFDWVMINLDTHKVDKLSGVKSNGTFLYLPGGVDIDVDISDGEIRFIGKPGQGPAPTAASSSSKESTIDPVVLDGGAF